MNPNAVTAPMNRLLRWNASGIIVSASMAGTPPAARAVKPARNPSLTPSNATAPKIDAMVDATTTIAQTPSTYLRDRPA